MPSYEPRGVVGVIAPWKRSRRAAASNGVSFRGWQSCTCTKLALGTPPLTGALDDGKPDFAEQAGWQHTCGYQCALGSVYPFDPQIRFPAFSGRAAT